MTSLYKFRNKNGLMKSMIGYIKDNEDLSEFTENSSIQIDWIRDYFNDEISNIDCNINRNSDDDGDDYTDFSFNFFAQIKKGERTIATLTELIDSWDSEEYDGLFLIIDKLWGFIQTAREKHKMLKDCLKPGYLLT